MFRYPLSSIWLPWQSRSTLIVTAVLTALCLVVLADIGGRQQLNHYPRAAAVPNDDAGTAEAAGDLADYRAASPPSGSAPRLAASR